MRLFRSILIVMFMIIQCKPVLAERFALPRTQVHTLVHALAAPDVQRSYDVYIHLPPGYDANRERPYPVVYLTDGSYTFPVAVGVSRLPFFFNEFEKVIFVGLSAAKGEDLMASRQRDLTPFAPSDWKHPGGGAHEYLAFIESIVFPFVEREFNAAPAQRTLVGQSYGGLFGAWVLLTRPALFENYILTSSSLWVMRHRIFGLESEAKTESVLRDRAPVRVYFAIGALETGATPGPRGTSMIADQAYFAERLRRHESITVKDEVVADATHGTTFPTGFIKGMQWLHRVDQ